MKTWIKKSCRLFKEELDSLTNHRELNLFTSTAGDAKSRGGGGGGGVGGGGGGVGGGDGGGGRWRQWR